MTRVGEKASTCGEKVENCRKNKMYDAWRLMPSGFDCELPAVRDCIMAGAANHKSKPPAVSPLLATLHSVGDLDSDDMLLEVPASPPSTKALLAAWARCRSPTMSSVLVIH